MLSFHNDLKIKAKYINRVNAHIEADELVRGIGFENGKGCAVGCTLDNYDHAAYETELGLPEWLARLEDTIFENMSVEKSKTWPRDLLEAIPVGVDLSRVKYKFAVYLMQGNIERVKDLAISRDLKEKVINAIELCLHLNISACNSGVFDESAARSAWSAAESAESAARSAARSAWSAAESAESAARSAAWSAAESAESAARSAAWAARSAAESAESAWAFDLHADTLLQMLRDSK